MTTDDKQAIERFQTHYKYFLRDMEAALAEASELAQRYIAKFTETDAQLARAQERVKHLEAATRALEAKIKSLTATAGPTITVYGIFGDMEDDTPCAYCQSKADADALLNGNTAGDAIPFEVKESEWDAFWQRHPRSEA